MFAPFFSFLRLEYDISVADQVLIESELRHRLVAEDEYLAHAGHVCRELFFICQGVLRVVAQQEKGTEVTYFFVKENHLCTILDSFTKQVVAQESIKAACPTEVLVLSHDGLHRLYGQLPYLRDVIDRITQRTLLEKIQARNQYLGQDAASRYELFLQRQPDVARRVSLRDVASYLGITQQSLSRIRRHHG
jgi:CRP-like cAMP-binding protein